MTNHFLQNKRLERFISSIGDKWLKKNTLNSSPGTSLVVHWLGLHTSPAGEFDTWSENWDPTYHTAKAKQNI